MVTPTFASLLLVLSLPASWSRTAVEDGSEPIAPTPTSSANVSVGRDHEDQGPRRRIPISPRTLELHEPRLRAALHRAFRVALVRADAEGCSALFRRFERSAVDLLRATIYTPARNARERSICHRRSAAAFTAPGSSRTVLCPAFGRLPAPEAATVLLHEALHHGGLPEWPRDPLAPPSSRIHASVAASCPADRAA